MPNFATRMLLSTCLAASSLNAIAQLKGYWPKAQFDPSYQNVSMIQLLANRKEGSRNRLLTLECEGNAIYLHREGYQHGIYAKCVLD